MAVVTAASLLSRMNWAGYLRYAGRNSIVLYVSFVLPMAATRILLLKSGLISNIGAVSLLVTLVARCRSRSTRVCATPGLASSTSGRRG
ncbi:MAG TPA: hypothetical protein VLW88_00700 [Hyphomicrobium sp.]|nr:hypothetical protein [Hyphomicrobium sp.]